MKISVKTANDIVGEISRAVNQPVNLMDDNGIIIASTDPQRIGTEHVGARRIIREKLDCLTIDTDQEYRGSKVGINMPIYFRGEITGVIGISGEWNQVAQYVTLIRKSTELLLMDSYLQQNADVLYARRNKFLHDLLFEDPERLPVDFLELGKRLNLDLRSPRRCICMSFVLGAEMDLQTMQQLLDRVERTVSHEGEILYYREPTQISLFLLQTKEKEIQLFCEKLRQKMFLPTGVILKIGVDDQARIGIPLRICKEKAEKSLRYAMGGSKRNMEFYGDLRSGLVLDEISDSAKREYIQRIFPGMDREEIVEWAEILDVFYRCDGSITKAAEELFMHKNTLQYQLKKLAAQTGCDPRSMANAGLYQAAILFLRSLH